MSKPIRVLLADDTDDVRAILRATLTADGRFVVVGEARNGAEAVEMAGAARPDVVLLDLAMPVMDGLEAAPKILEHSPRSKIVVLSGFEAERMAERARAAGAHRYVEKGAALADIATVLAEVSDVTDAIDVRHPSPAPPSRNFARPTSSGARCWQRCHTIFGLH